MNRLFEEYDGNFPEQLIEEYLLAAFPFTAEQLHEILAYHYDPAEKVYHYEGGRGGGPIAGAVTAVRTLAGGFVELDYEMLAGYYDERSTEEKEAYLIKRTGTLTLAAAPNGGYRYWSVDYQNEIQLEA